MGRHELGGLDRVVERLGLFPRGLPGRHRGRQARGLRDLLRHGAADAREIVVKERGDVPGLGLVEHFQQDPQLHAVRMRLDLERRLGQLLRHARVFVTLSIGRHVRDAGVRVGHGGLLDESVDRVPALLVRRLDLQLDARSVLHVPRDRALVVAGRRLLRGQLPVGDDHGLVSLGVDLDLELVDSLLAARLPQGVELGAIEKLAEDAGNLRLHDAGAVVLDHDAEASLADLGDHDREIRKDSRFLAGVQRVVHGLLDGREQRLRGAVETQQVAVLGEELADRDLALARGHVGGREPDDRFGGFCGLRSWGGFSLGSGLLGGRLELHLGSGLLLRGALRLVPRDQFELSFSHGLPCVRVIASRS